MTKKQESEKIAIQYLKENREKLFEQYLQDKFPLDQNLQLDQAVQEKQSLVKNL